MGGQLSLFGGGDDDHAPPKHRSGLVQPHVTEHDRELAARLPRFVRFGTSSWSFPGWAGIVWKGTPSEAELARSGLEAYAQHPLLRAVSLDRSYYGPVREEDLAGYEAQLGVAREKAPELPRFRVLSKVWDEITTAVFPRHPRYGARAGMKNPHFLDAERFQSEVLAPYRRSLSAESGPFVFELTPMPQGSMDERALVARVDDFVAHLPAGLRCAFELRNAELFGTRWLDMLKANGAAHVFTYWTAMPPLGVQLRARPIGAPFTVVRLMLPPYTRYAARKADFAPFDKLSEPQPEMRDDVVDILRAAAEAGCDEGFVLVNNKAEGSAPLTVRALAEKTAAAFER
ncbi:MAG: hypothetical protein BGO98_42905 [Myxococcales bacterium 68-20]|nr:DUF72 domain-containing protein [Myxococcales bacterium]OJY29144.1 MAG: hypothetical protein BGO98_42905 [Myxococcales bacterium 68-20]